MENNNIIIGQNAEDNWKILKEAKQNYIWFHLDNLSSPYVILQELIKDSTKDQIYEAALACKENSKYKNIPQVTVIYTEVKNIKKGSKVGQAIIKSNKKCKKIIV